MSREERSRLSIDIRRDALCFGIGWADHVEIDALNILQATFLAMRRALLAMTLTPDHVLVDGNRLPNLTRTRQGIDGARHHRRRCHRAGYQRGLDSGEDGQR